MQSSSEQPLVGEERYVTTRITAAKETIQLAVYHEFCVPTMVQKMSAFQRFFRRKAIDAFAGEKSFMCRKPVSNQRIEAWWDQLRREGMDWWDFFEERQLMHLPGKRVLCMEDQSQYCLRGSQKLYRGVTN